MSSINCEVCLTLNWCKECVLFSNAVASQTVTFAITDTKLYVLVVTLSIQDNAKLFKN